jgi:hypothetical protein
MRWRALRPVDQATKIPFDSHKLLALLDSPAAGGGSSSSSSGSRAPRRSFRHNVVFSGTFVETAPDIANAVRESKALNIHHAKLNSYFRTKRGTKGTKGTGKHNAHGTKGTGKGKAKDNNPNYTRLGKGDAVQTNSAAGRSRSSAAANNPRAREDDVESNGGRSKRHKPAIDAARATRAETTAAPATQGDGDIKLFSQATQDVAGME